MFAVGGTGGHLYPGLAIARTLVRLYPQIAPFFVGAQRGIERTVLPKTEFPHLLLDLHPLYRSAFWNNWRTVVGGVGAWRRVAALVREDRPKLVVGTGGYAAGVMLGYASMHGIPIVQQAGDSYPGLTARWFSRRSLEMYLAFPEAARLLKAHHDGSLIDTGAPIEPPPSPFPEREAARARWGFAPNSGRVLLVYGGSQGSLAINRAIAQWIESGSASDWNVIWATGTGSYEQFKGLDSSRVRVRDYLSPIAEAYAATDLAVARAGAMTTAELFAWGIPAILVPLPTAAADHQTYNAVTLEKAGAAVTLAQSQLSADRLDGTIQRLVTTSGEMDRLAAGARARARPNAADYIARRIGALLGLP